MFTADQFVAHLVGDYIFQSHWMATNKTKDSFAAWVHAATYTIPFMFITQSQVAWLFIMGTHFLIDRFRLARFVVWAKNGYSFTETVTNTGYKEDVPVWLSVWLLIIADNTIHLICNGVAIAYL